MISFRSMQAAARSRGDAGITYTFNFTRAGYRPPNAAVLYMDFMPQEKPSFNFYDNTYIPPSGGAITFNF